MISFREGNYQDIPKIIKLLADDPLGSKREKIDKESQKKYIDAFNEILEQDNNFIIVCDYKENNIVAFAQITIIPTISISGKKRALIEEVRVDKKYRGQGFGKSLVNNLCEFAKNNDCSIVQLTTDKSRSEALEFYKSLGFIDSHIGMKLYI